MNMPAAWQVEYQLSNANLSANESLVKLMSKDPEGYGGPPFTGVTFRDLSSTVF